MRALLTDLPEINANDLVMAKTMADTLDKHYPGHLWGVSCDGAQGIAVIRNLALSGSWGFLLKLPAIYSASEFAKEVVRGGGELLERYRVKRGRANPEQLLNLPTDFAGRTLVDL